MHQCVHDEMMHVFSVSTVENSRDSISLLVGISGDFLGCQACNGQQFLAGGFNPSEKY